MAFNLPVEQIEELRNTKYNATVIELKKAHSDLMIVRVKPDKAIRPHRAGQYTLLGLGYWEGRYPGCQEESIPEEELSKLARRAYSLSSSILGPDGSYIKAEENDWNEFYIVLVRETGREIAPALTPRLFNLEVGSRLFMGEKITGHYNLSHVKPDDDVIFFSTGTGEAPHNYMALEMLRNNHQGKIISACCVRMGKDLGYLDVHDVLMKNAPNYKYIALTTREGDPSKKRYLQDLVRSGEIEAILGSKLNPEKTHVYLCGNPAMIGAPFKHLETGVRTYPKPEGIIELLESRGFNADLGHGHAPGNIHFEEYWS